MRLKSKLRIWREKGVISPAQSDEILAFERAKTSRHFAVGMQLCGGLAILLGFALIIAANWHELGRYAKIGGHFILNAGLSLWLFKIGYERTKPVLQELLTLALFGLNLTFIVLIGQVFQLDGKLYEALLLWMILSAPTIIIYARTGFSAWLWMVAFYVSAVLIYAGVTEGWDDYSRFMLGFFLCLFLPLGFYADHNLRWTQHQRPAFAECFRSTSLYAALMAASAVSTLFYGDAQDIVQKASSVFAHYAYIICVTVLAFGYILALRRYFAQEDDDFDWGILGICVLFTAIPFLIPVKAAVFSAAHFVLLWLCIGAWAQRYHVLHVINAAIALVAMLPKVSRMDCSAGPILERFHSCRARDI